MTGESGPSDEGRVRTEHEVVVGDARGMGRIEDDAVQLVVTSPPYPMIEMWDETFVRLDPTVADRLADDDAWGAFELMHEALDDVWDELVRVLAPGGIACVNVGDATRTVGGEFTCFPNHARVLTALVERGLRPLPGVVWRKPTNSTTKFLGSGTLPPNAYVTLEHEHVLVLRKGSPRTFDPGDDRRYESAFFWEERNEWFSDLWTDVTGARQAIDGDGPRDRTGAFPFEVPFRLINMFSVRGDTVLDPFWGTGTTSVAAMVAARNSIGYEVEPGFRAGFDERVGDLEARSREIQRGRLRDHREFVESRRKAGAPPTHDAPDLGLPVVTGQETQIRLYAISELTVEDDRFVATHEPIEPQQRG